MGKDRRVLVLGGGVAGLTAATALADMGLQTILVEQAAYLGGHASNWACMATDECARCSACTIEDLIRKALGHPELEIITNAMLDGVEGNTAEYMVRISPYATAAVSCGGYSDRVLSSERTLDVSCMVVATGFDVYDPAVEPLLGYGRLPGVLTLKDMDAALRRDDLDSVLPRNDEPVRIGFIQCVGSRDRMNGRGYCSQFCCRATIRMLNRLLWLRPDLQAVVFYIDLQLMSKEFRVFYEKARQRVRFVQGVAAEIYGSDDKDSLLKVYGTEPGEAKAKAFEFHRIVLATGISPSLSRRNIGDLLGVAEDAFGFLPTVREDKGIFTAGACAGPTDMQGSIRTALAAANQVASWLDRTTTEATDGGSHVNAQ